MVEVSVGHLDLRLDDFKVGLRLLQPGGSAFDREPTASQLFGDDGTLVRHVLVHRELLLRVAERRLGLGGLGLGRFDGGILHGQLGAERLVADTEQGVASLRLARHL